MPGEYQSHPRVRGHLSSLAAVVVREEGEAAIVEHLEQNEPDGRNAIRGRGRKGHRIRFVKPRRERLVEPGAEEGERIHARLGLG